MFIFRFLCVHLLLSCKPQFSEDLKAADVDANDEEDVEGEWVRAGGPEDSEREDVGLDALLGVDDIVVREATNELC